MRFGTSWPVGHGRREWISGGPVFWLVFGWLFLLAAMIVLMVKVAGLIILGVIEAARWAWQRWQERQRREARARV